MYKHVRSISCFKYILEAFEYCEHLMIWGLCTCRHNQYLHIIFKCGNCWDCHWHNFSYSLHIIYLYIIMPPKTIFTIPLGDVTEIIAETKQTKHGVWRSTKEVPFYSSKKIQSGQSSVPKPQANANVVQAQTSRLTYEGTKESHPLPTRDIQEDGFEDIQIDEEQVQWNVWALLHPCIAQYLKVSRHQWINGCRSEADISVTGDGGSHKVSSLFNVQQRHADQV